MQPRSILHYFYMYDVLRCNFSQYKNDIKDLNNNVVIMETLKNNIIYSMTFEGLEQLQISKRVFVNKENMSLIKIQIGVMGVFSENATTADNYIQLSFLKCEFKVYSLKLSLHKGGKSDAIELYCNFYKGDHK